MDWSPCFVFRGLSFIFGTEWSPEPLSKLSISTNVGADPEHCSVAPPQNKAITQMGIILKLRGKIIPKVD